jgi:putative addiction module antidote
MTQKIIQVGNSLAVTLPSSFVKSNKIKAGQEVFVYADPDLATIEIKTNEGAFSSLTPEFKDWLDSVGKKYKDVIQELAKR